VSIDEAIARLQRGDYGADLTANQVHDTMEHEPLTSWAMLPTVANPVVSVIDLGAPVRSVYRYVEPAVRRMFAPVSVVQWWTFDPRNQLADASALVLLDLLSMGYGLIVYGSVAGLDETIAESNLPPALGIYTYVLATFEAPDDEHASNVAWRLARAVAAGALTHLPECRDDHEAWQAAIAAACLTGNAPRIMRGALSHGGPL
jgi:hypothetical protein